MSQIKFPTLAIFLTALSMAACATEPEAAHTGWDRYKTFAEELQSQQLEFDFRPFFTKGAYQDVVEAKGEDKLNVKESLAYPLYFASTANHLERSKKKGFCLVVNGLTTHGDAAGLSIEFLEESGSLKFNDANFIFVDSADDFLSEAKCPAETRAL